MKSATKEFGRLLRGALPFSVVNPNPQNLLENVLSYNSTDDAGAGVTLIKADGDIAVGKNLNLNNGNLAVGSGLVGIGTDQPATLIHAKATSSDNFGIAKLRLEDSQGRAVEIQTPSSGADNGRIGTITNHDFEIHAGNGNGTNFIRFLTDNDEKMRITNAGNVGIGTDVPTNAKSVIMTEGVEGANEVALHLTHGDGALATDQQVSLNFGNSADADVALAQVGAGYGGSNYDGYLVFKTNEGSIGNLTERMRIHSDGAVSIGGNTGLNSAYGILNLSNGNGTGNTALYIEDAGGIGYSLGIVDGSQSFSISEGANLNSQKRFEIDTNGNLSVDTDTLYVDAINDRVGINDTSPDFALDCNVKSGDLASIAACFSTNAAQASISFQGTGTTDNASARFGVKNNDNFFMYQNDANTFFFGEDAKMGIGTMSPTAALSVQYNPATTNRFELIDNRDEDQKALVTASGGEMGIYTTTNGNFSSSNLAVTVDTSQRVGIGTDQPSYKLDVDGTVNVEGQFRTSMTIASPMLVEVVAGTYWSLGWWQASDNSWWLLGKMSEETSGFTRANAEFYVPLGMIADVPTS